MKNLIMGIFLVTTTIIVNALPIENVNIYKNNSTVKLGQSEDLYLKKVFNSVPDMRYTNQKSKKKSEIEGSTLQVVMTNGLAKTGFNPDSFSRLLNNESSIVKDYVKNKNIKGYFFITHNLVFSKGYPDIPDKALKEFKERAECQKDYCVLVDISKIQILDQEQKEINLNSEEFIKLSQNYNDKNNLWEVNSVSILQPYKLLSVSLVTGFGLGGLDAMALIKKNAKTN